MSEMTVFWVYIVVETALLIFLQFSFQMYKRASKDLENALRKKCEAQNDKILLQERLIGLQKERIETLEEFVTKMNAGGQ